MGATAGLVGTAVSLVVGSAAPAFASDNCAGSLGTAGGYGEWVAGSAARGEGTIGGPVAYGGAATFGAYPTPDGPTIANSEPTSPSSTLNLIVGGSATVDGPTTLAAGSGVIAGPEAAFSTLTVDGGGSVTNDAGTSALPFSFTTVGSGLVAESNTWAADSALAPTVNGTTLTLTGTDPTQDIFDVTEAQLAAATSVVINVPTSTLDPTILINVTGTGAYTSPTGQTFSYTNGGTAEAATTLWNFNQASNVTLSGETWQGTILAPFVTTLTASNGTINGSLIVGGSGAGGALKTATSSNWNTNLNLFAGSCLPSNTSIIVTTSTTAATTSTTAATTSTTSATTSTTAATTSTTSATTSTTSATTSTTQPSGGQVPESPFVPLLPASAAGLVGGGFVLYRFRHRRRANS